MNSNASTPSFAGKQMSSSLKERLKRCGRYHASPSPLAPQSRHLPESRHGITPGTSQSGVSKTRLPLSESPAVSVNVPSPAMKRDIAYCASTCSGPVAKKLRISVESHDLPQMETVKKVVCHNPVVEINTDNNTSANDSQDCSPSLTDNSRCKEPESSVSKVSRSEITPIRSRSHYKGSRSSMPMLKGSKLNFDTKSLTEHSSNKTVTVACEHKSDTSTVLKDKETTIDSSKGEECTGQVSETCLLERLKNAEEELRQLKMVKMYRSKNNLDDLETLITKWRDVSQRGLQDLHSLMPEPKPTLTQLLEHLGIRHKLVKYDEDTESFEG